MVGISTLSRVKLELAKFAGRRLAKGKHQSRPFVLLSRQRSGSTWLMDLLDSHPAMRVYDELFHAGGHGHPRVGRNRDILCWKSYAALHRPGSRLEKLRLYFQYLDREVYSQNTWVAGFKLMYNQAATELAVLAYLSLHNVSILHLIRRNFLDAVLSEETLAARGVFHAEVGARLRQLRVELDTCTLLDRLEEREAEVHNATRFFAAAGLPYHEVFYEDLLTDLHQAIRPVLRFLHVREDAHLTSSLAKINPTDHRQLLSNYEQVRTTLAGTRFAGLLR